MTMVNSGLKGLKWLFQFSQRSRNQNMFIISIGTFYVSSTGVRVAMKCWAIATQPAPVGPIHQHGLSHLVINTNHLSNKTTLVQWLKLAAWKVGDRRFEPHSGLQVL